MMSAADPPPRRSVVSTRRRWLFRFMAMVVLPLLALGLSEVVLRLVDYGHPTSFFVRHQINGSEMLVDNTWFGRRFFPPTLARSPSPVVMRAPKPPGTYRIFLFGESAALGDPRPAFGVGRYLEALLRERFPGAEFEVVCVAVTAINSHAILEIARECAQYQGDLWIVYMGNNEIAGPFGANTVFGPQAPPIALVRSYLAFQRLQVGQALTALTRKLASGTSPPSSWGGLKMFLDHQLAPGDPRKDRVYAHFRRNLSDILDAARGAGVPVLLNTVACNLKDCAPFGSLHAPPLRQPEIDDWTRLCRTGITNAQQGRWMEAERAFQQAAQKSPHHAEPQFRLGQCYLETTNLEAARHFFERARDWDALPFRADSRVNAIIKQVAGEFAGKGAHFLDTAGALESLCSGGIPGQEVFYDHVHLNFTGNYGLARAWAGQIMSLLPANITGRQTTDWAGPVLCAQRLGLTDWNRYPVFEEVLRRLSEAPFTNQLNHSSRFKYTAGQMMAIREGLTPASASSAWTVYEEALAKRPLDPWIHHNYAEFLVAIGDLAQATAQMQKVGELFPHHYAAYLQIGRLLARQKKGDEARFWLERALRLRPDLSEAYLELAQILAGQGQLEEALRQLAVAQRYRPEDPWICLRRADVLAAQKKRDEALENVREAIRLRPSFWEAHYLLGVELAQDGQDREAQTEFAEVVRWRPDHVLARLNWGVMLARQGRMDEARTKFQETLRLDPQNEKARQFIENLKQSEPGHRLP